MRIQPRGFTKPGAQHSSGEPGAVQSSGGKAKLWPKKRRCVATTRGQDTLGAVAVPPPGAAFALAVTHLERGADVVGLQLGHRPPLPLGVSQLWSSILAFALGSVAVCRMDTSCHN
jgi:hypothetical protein